MSEQPCPNKFWCLLSGGKDSMTTASVLAEKGQLLGAVFLDTGIAVPDLLPHIQRVCEDRGWPLDIYRAPKSYEDLVHRWGFPGPAMHNVFMSHLKGRGIRQFKKAHPGEALASGVRSGESKRRLTNVTQWSTFEGVQCHAPIFDWSTERVWGYVREHDLPLSPAYRAIHLSGDCLCGAFAEPAEVGLIGIFYPEVASRLQRLEVALQAKGEIQNIRARRWGGGTGALGFSAAQTKLETFLCSGCSTP